DVDKALIAIQETARQERLQRAAVVSARRAFDIAEERLRGGTVDLTTVLTIQQTLFQAQDVLALARLAHLQAIVGLSRHSAPAGRAGAAGCRLRKAAPVGAPIRRRPRRWGANEKAPKIPRPAAGRHRPDRRRARHYEPGAAAPEGLQGPRCRCAGPGAGRGLAH